MAGMGQKSPAITEPPVLNKERKREREEGNRKWQGGRGKLAEQKNG
jgi:hypothetical protein